ncbi:MAG: hypothetical protein WC340_08335 [Kiritimatiellia bacterium]
MVATEALRGLSQIHLPKTTAFPASSPLSPQNEKIQEARAAALAVLKPSQKERWSTGSLSTPPH